jgi:hypothetical protein
MSVPKCLFPSFRQNARSLMVYNRSLVCMSSFDYHEFSSLYLGTTGKVFYAEILQLYQHEIRILLVDSQLGLQQEEGCLC